MTRTHVKGLSVWKMTGNRWTDRQMDRWGDCITSRANTVGNNRICWEEILNSQWVLEVRGVWWEGFVRVKDAVVVMLLIRCGKCRLYNAMVHCDLCASVLAGNVPHWAQDVVTEWTFTEDCRQHSWRDCQPRYYNTHTDVCCVNCEIYLHCVASLFFLRHKGCKIL